VMAPRLPRRAGREAKGETDAEQERA
jgi:hypothetical protein